MILLNPGPVTLSARVRAALPGPDLCHREAEFAQLTRDLADKLESVYAQTASDYAAVLLSGSGTAAVEAMISTFAPSDAPTLVLCNGVYGERIVDMLTAQRKPVIPARLPWEAAIDVTQVERLLAENPAVTHVALVHHETTSGRLNQIEAIAALCQEKGRHLLLDAVSSFGAEHIDFAHWRPLAVAGTANKCLHGIPGLSFVLAQRQALENQPTQATTLYLDLQRYYQAQKSGWSPFTQAIPAFIALNVALDEFREAGGWLARQALFRQRSEAVRQTLHACGIQTLIPATDSASMLTTYCLPATHTYRALHDDLKAAGYIIYAGQGHYSNQVFRIATMGQISASELQTLQTRLTRFFSRNES